MSYSTLYKFENLSEDFGHSEPKIFVVVIWSHVL